jgi:NTE family protein
MQRRTLLGLDSLVLTGCSAFDYRGPDAPEPLAVPPPLRPAPRSALVLGAGGPRGYAHLAVLRVFEERGWVPDLIVGSSVGALIGVFWASGMSAAELERLSRSGGPLTLFDPNPFADRGWIRGQKLQDYVQAGLQGRPLQALPRPVIVVATRRRDKAARFFTRGHAGVAVRASSAVPGIVSPVGIGGEEYEDGDESLPLAVQAARQAGASLVVAVNVYPTQTPPEASAFQRARDARRRRAIAREQAFADLLLQADAGYATGPFQRHFDAAYAAGERVALRAWPQLQALVTGGQEERPDPGTWP